MPSADGVITSGRMCPALVCVVLLGIGTCFLLLAARGVSLTRATGSNCSMPERCDTTVANETRAGMQRSARVPVDGGFPLRSCPTYLRALLWVCFSRALRAGHRGETLGPVIERAFSFWHCRSRDPRRPAFAGSPARSSTIRATPYACTVKLHGPVLHYRCPTRVRARRTP